VPVQERSERRVATFLGHAEALIGEVGHEAATMTEIAERAGASIGAVYQYFPNKEAIIQALRDAYGVAIEAEWDRVEADIDRLDAGQLADRILTFMVAFANQRMAFFPLLNAPTNYAKYASARERKRERLAGMFRRKNPRLTVEQAARISNVTLQTMKGLFHLLGEAKPRERGPIEAEYRRMIVSYLRHHLGPADRA
jgi:AcrR family transcriptional regulator